MDRNTLPAGSSSRSSSSHQSKLPIRSASRLSQHQSSRESPDLALQTPGLKNPNASLKRSFNNLVTPQIESANKRPNSYQRPGHLQNHLVTPITSRHLPSLPPSTVRTNQNVRSESENILLTHEKLREIQIQLDSAQIRISELERDNAEQSDREFTLERKVLDLEREAREQQARLDEREARIKKLEQDRQFISSQIETEDKEKSKLIDQANQQAKIFQSASQSAQDELIKIKELNSSLEQRVRLLSHNESRAQQISLDANSRIKLLEEEKETTQKEIVQLTRQLSESQVEIDKLQKDKQTSQSHLSHATPDSSSREVLMKELSHQVDRFKSLEQNNQRLTRELSQLKVHNANVELLKEENQHLKSRLCTLDQLRQQLASTEVELSKLSQERSEWAVFIEQHQQEFNSPHEFFKLLATTRVENLSLKAKLGSSEVEIKSRDRLIEELESRLEEVENERQVELTEKLKAQAQFKTVDRSRELDRLRIQMLNEQLKSYATEEKSFSDGMAYNDQKNLQLENLQELLDSHQKELVKAQTELLELRQPQAHSSTKPSEVSSTESPHKPSPVKSSLAEQIRLKEQLENELDDLADENEVLKMEIKSLELQVHRLERDLGRGEYNKLTTQVLCPEGSPVQKEYAIRKATLEALQAENAALLKRISKLEKGIRQSGQECESLVPRDSLVSCKHEISKLEAEVLKLTKARERLCEMYRDTTATYKRAMWEILGYSLEAVANGEFRLRSAFKDENSATMLFVPGKADGGSMEYKPSPHHPFHQSEEVVKNFNKWVINRKSLPCFTAALTLELYESSTTRF
ncbi:hypothetical protein O181_029934 [Austropuccinia psidii MF-1]|uniref:Spindle assembly checkpoint component MAD1 n=1 Tax=Austropuccinia psidii MF-1 TaxID=1389203 RepID=A0A9Q3CT55_9BASI|nr:hypothetical protein [Austropuccinia psidii MF-1]